MTAEHPHAPRPWLQMCFDALDRVEHFLSLHWREHTNQKSILLIFILGIVAAMVYTQIIVPPADFPAGELVTIEEGLTVSAAGTVLADAGVIRSPLAFRMLITFFAGSRGAKAGDYVFKEPVSVWSVARAVSLGQFGLEPMRVRIPEGATVVEMAKLYGKVLPRFDEEAFVAIAKPEEGFLFPDTYFFLPNVREDTVLRTMRENFDARTASIQAEVASSSRTMYEIVTMASIIEREARISADRHMISGVLWNRIDMNMALQVDAVFLYTLGRATFDLTMKDLVTDAPYNTYTRKGLPPTPIGSPSLDSIHAALHPTPNKFIFYLADNSGVTHFSKTYQEHLQKKALYLGT